MARALRIEYEGGRYHVINRGNFRRNLFGEKGGAEAFEGVLGEAAENTAGGAGCESGDRVG